MFLSFLLFIGNMNESFTIFPTEGMDYSGTVSKCIKYLSGAVSAVEKNCSIENADKNIIKQVQRLGVELVEQTCSNVSAFIYFVFLYLCFCCSRHAFNDWFQRTEPIKPKLVAAWTKPGHCSASLNVICFVLSGYVYVFDILLQVQWIYLKQTSAGEFSVTCTASHFPLVLKI